MAAKWASDLFDKFPVTTASLYVAVVIIVILLLGYTKK
jgi:hypothetical protein